MSVGDLIERLSGMPRDDEIRIGNALGTDCAIDGVGYSGGMPAIFAAQDEYDTAHHIEEEEML